MTVPSPSVPAPDPHAPRRLSPNVAALGYVGMLTAMSSAMIYGLLPVFMVRVLGISIASVGVIEGMAEAAASLIKIVSGAASDRIGRRKPFVIFGYTLSDWSARSNESSWSLIGSIRYQILTPSDRL